MIHPRLIACGISLKHRTVSKHLQTASSHLRTASSLRKLKVGKGAVERRERHERHERHESHDAAVKHAAASHVHGRRPPRITPLKIYI